jgi:hypothetical protein
MCSDWRDPANWPPIDGAWVLTHAPDLEHPVWPARWDSEFQVWRDPHGAHRPGVARWTPLAMPLSG